MAKSRWEPPIGGMYEGGTRGESNKSKGVGGRSQPPTGSTLKIIRKLSSTSHKWRIFENPTARTVHYRINWSYLVVYRGAPNDKCNFLKSPGHGQPNHVLYLRSGDASSELLSEAAVSGWAEGALDLHLGILPSNSN